MRQHPRMIRTKRIYEEAREDDGVRVLVDRLWPRGISKERASLAAWMKEIAPSDALRKRFHNQAENRQQENWEAFIEAYRRELQDLDDRLDELLELAAGKPLTLLFASKNTDRNNAVALKRILESRE